MFSVENVEITSISWEIVLMQWTFNALIVNGNGRGHARALEFLRTRLSRTGIPEEQTLVSASSSNSVLRRLLCEKKL